MAASIATTSIRSSRASARTVALAGVTALMTAPRRATACSFSWNLLGSVGCVGKGEVAVGVLVEHVVEQRQQRHGFLLDVRDLPLDQLERAATQRVPAGVVEPAGSGGLGQRTQLGGDRADGLVL